MNLIYNIDYEIIALLFTLLLYIEMRINYPIQNKKNKEFRLITITVIITEIFDLLSAITNSYANIVPIPLNMILNSCYFMSGLFLCFTFHHYIETAVIGLKKQSFLLIINKYILLIVEIIALINIFFGYIFYFTPSGSYERGTLYFLLHLTSLWFFLCAFLTLFLNRNKIDKKYILPSLSFILVYYLSVIAQTFIFPNVLIIMPAVSGMLIIAIFSLESPDYIKLQAMLKELLITKQQLEQANIKYYNLAYSDLMTGLYNRSAYNIHLNKLESASNIENVIFLIADINGLKNLNDNLGHLIGDEAIEKTAQIIKNIFDSSCKCYRIGGDEFAVIADDISIDEFDKKYNHLIQEIDKETKISPYNFSIATGYQIIGSLSVQEALKKADEKMYINKAEFKHKNQ